MMVRITNPQGEVQVTTLEDAAARMGHTVEDLKGNLDRDGFCETHAADGATELRAEWELGENFSAVTGAALVARYNEMVALWIAGGGDNTFGRVNRFATAEVGRTRCARIFKALQDKGVKVKDRSLTVMAAETNQPEAAPDQSGEQSEDDDMAKKAKKAKKATGAKRPRGDGPTLASYREEFNSLVPAAKKAGVAWAKVHTSEFESKTKGAAMVAKLKDAIRKAK